MRNVKSNINILKKNNSKSKMNPSKSNNNLKKSSTTLRIDEHNLNNKIFNNNNYINLFEKQFSSIIFNNYKENSKNKKYKNKANKTNYSGNNIIFNNNNYNINKGICIRFNFKNKIINNNFIRSKKTSKKNKNNDNNLNYDFNNDEKFKEKEKQINLLQKELLKSQKLLNQFKEEKQKQITSNYKTIKNIDSNINNNNSINSNKNRISKYSSLTDIFASNPEKNLHILKTNNKKEKLSPNKPKSHYKNKNLNKKNNLNILINNSSSVKSFLFNYNTLNTNKNCKTRNNIYKTNRYDNYYSRINSKTNKKNKNNPQSKLIRLLSNSPDKILKKYLNYCDSNSKNKKMTVKKNLNTIKYNLNKNTPLSHQKRVNRQKKNSPSSFQNKVKKKGSSSSSQNRDNRKKNNSSSNSDNKIVNNKKIETKNINNNIKCKDINYIINKAEELKKRTKNILNKYIMLSYQINKLEQNKNN